VKVSMAEIAGTFEVSESLTLDTIAAYVSFYKRFEYQLIINIGLSMQKSPWSTTCHGTLQRLCIFLLGIGGDMSISLHCSRW